MGATDLDLDIHIQRRFDLPQQVFESESLTSLSLSGGKFGIEADANISCSGLKSLTLHNVYLYGEVDIIRDVISRLKSLSLDNVYGDRADAVRNMISSCPVIEKLSLYRVRVDALFFDDFSCKFPRLKELSVHHCNGCKVIQISSRSLDCINFTWDTNFRMFLKLHVPNIRKFVFSGLSVPSLSFKTTTSTWESDISIKHQSRHSVAWFVELNELLKQLSLSKVSLSLEMLSEESLDCEGRIQDSTKPEVENLMISGPCAVCPAFFYCIFQCCRPTYITQHWFPMSKRVGKKRNDILEFVYKGTMQQIGLSTCVAYQRMSGECDLEEVSVEFYDESVSMWRPRLLDTSTKVGADEQRSRLHLRWGYEPAIFQ